MKAFVHDLRFALRMLARSPGFTLAVVVLLALGLGANTTILNLVNAVLVRPIPGIAEPDRLVMLGRTHHGEGFNPLSYPDYADYRDRNSVFSGLAAYSQVAFNLSSEGVTERIPGAVVSGSYFQVLGVDASAGRTFMPEEDRVPGRDAVAVISHRLWQRRWAGAPEVVGTTVMLNAHPFTVIGVAREGFLGVERGVAADVWVPIMMQERAKPGGKLLEARDGFWLDPIARLKPGIHPSQAKANLQSVASRLEKAYPRQNRGKGIRVAPYNPIGGPDTATNATTFLGMMTAFSVLMLLVVCANIANLLLARGSVRKREIAIRAALGAGKGRLVRQSLTEGLLLSALGGVAGLFMAMWSADLLAGCFPLIPSTLDFGPDLRVAACVLVLAIVTALVFAVIPALRASRPEVLPNLKAGEATTIPRRSLLRNVLVIAQLALCVVLLTGAGLLMRTLQSMRSAHTGMLTDSVLLLSLDPRLNGYSDEAGWRLFEQVLERLRALPGVVSTSLGRVVPLSNVGMDVGRVYGGGSGESGIGSDCNLVSPEYLQSLGIPILRGREFRASDREGEPRVAVINETLARRLWPGQEPLGKTISLGSPKSEPWEIVGVARDSRYRHVTEAPRPFFYLPLRQRYMSDLTLHVQTTGDPLALVDPVKRLVRELDPALPVYNVKTMSRHLEDSLWLPRTGAGLAGILGIVAMIVATVGLYASMAYHAAQRTREIGLRMALGATSGNVLWQMLRSGLMLGLIGLAAGVLLALAATRVLHSILFGVAPTDPVAFLSASALLLIATLIASYVPARWATKVDPLVALRYE